MPRRCVIKRCRSDPASLFHWPCDPELSKQWTDFLTTYVPAWRLHRPYSITLNGKYLCRKHFADDCFVNKIRYDMGFSQKLQLKSSAVPTRYFEPEPGQDESSDEEESGDDDGESSKKKLLRMQVRDQIKRAFRPIGEPRFPKKETAWEPEPEMEVESQTDAEPEWQYEEEMESSPVKDDEAILSALAAYEKDTDAIPETLRDLDEENEEGPSSALHDEEEEKENASLSVFEEDAEAITCAEASAPRSETHTEPYVEIAKEKLYTSAQETLKSSAGTEIEVTNKLCTVGNTKERKIEETASSETRDCVVKVLCDCEESDKPSANSSNYTVRKTTKLAEKKVTKPAMDKAKKKSPSADWSGDSEFTMKNKVKVTPEGTPRRQTRASTGAITTPTFINLDSDEDEDVTLVSVEKPKVKVITPQPGHKRGVPILPKARVVPPKPLPGSGKTKTPVTIIQSGGKPAHVLRSVCTLHMECTDEPLSVEQIKKFKEAKAKFEQSQREIAALKNHPTAEIEQISPGVEKITIYEVAKPGDYDAATLNSAATTTTVQAFGAPPAPQLNPNLRVHGNQFQPNMVLQFDQNGQPKLVPMSQAQRTTTTIGLTGSTMSGQRLRFPGVAQRLGGPQLATQRMGLRPNVPMVGKRPFQPSVPLREMMKKPKMDVSWVPLSEFYYGRLEGNPDYFEEKEFRFKCCHCQKMLYNNLKAMVHIQNHLDMEQQQNLDLSDLTECKNCYLQFDTPFQKQQHVEQVHQAGSRAVICRICERDMQDQNALAMHMKALHRQSEMPYVCQLCKFRSSFYADVIDHFKKRHDNSNHLLCLYCLKIVKTYPVSSSSTYCPTRSYLTHLQKHQVRGHGKKCTACKLIFRNGVELDQHRAIDHKSQTKSAGSSNFSDSAPQVMVQVPPTSTKHLKSLNAPVDKRVQEFRQLSLESEAATLKCLECKKQLGDGYHLRLYMVCALCRYATNCSLGYQDHMLSYHGQGKKPKHKVKERLQERPLHCVCGFKSKLGNKMARHLVLCHQRTAYSVPYDDYLMGATGRKKECGKPTPGFFGMLGLVKKSLDLKKTHNAKTMVRSILHDVVNDIFPAETAAIDFVNEVLDKAVEGIPLEEAKIVELDPIPLIDNEYHLDPIPIMDDSEDESPKKKKPVDEEVPDSPWSGRRRTYKMMDSLKKKNSPEKSYMPKPIPKPEPVAIEDDDEPMESEDTVTKIVSDITENETETADSKTEDAEAEAQFPEDDEFADEKTEDAEKETENAEAEAEFPDDEIIEDRTDDIETEAEVAEDIADAEKEIAAAEAEIAEAKAEVAEVAEEITGAAKKIADDVKDSDEKSEEVNSDNAETSEETELTENVTESNMDDQNVAEIEQSETVEKAKTAAEKVEDDNEIEQNDSENVEIAEELEETAVEETKEDEDEADESKDGEDIWEDAKEEL